MQVLNIFFFFNTHCSILISTHYYLFPFISIKLPLGYQKCFVFSDSLTWLVFIRCATQNKRKKQTNVPFGFCGKIYCCVECLQRVSSTKFIWLSLLNIFILFYLLVVLGIYWRQWLVYRHTNAHMSCNKKHCKFGIRI